MADIIEQLVIEQLLSEDAQTKFDPSGEENSAELNVSATTFSEAVVWGTDWTTETVALQLAKKNIDLNPAFQRRDAWSDQEKSLFIESLMLGIPVPPIILAENKLKKNSYIVIDGKQRLLSIRRFYTRAEVDGNTNGGFIPLKLKGLGILDSLNGMTYQKLEEHSSEYITNIDNQSIRTIVIKNWPDEEFLYTVFLRLNTGSKKLSPQELRQALRPGGFLEFLDSATAESKTFLKILNNKKPDPRMKDIELALRFFAYQHAIECYDGNLKNFLDHTCAQLNTQWSDKEDEIRKEFEELETAIEFAYEIMPSRSPFSRYSKGKENNYFNRSIFEIFTYYFINEDIQELVRNNRQDFIDKFLHLNDDPDFIRSVSDTTKSIDRVILRHQKFCDILMSLERKSEISFRRMSALGSKIIVEEVIV